MATELTPVLKQRFFDANGAPLVGGKLYSYIAATTTPKPTYTDEGGLTQNPNPVILDADGYADVWMAEDGTAYKFALHDANDNPIFTVDNVFSIAAQITHQINVAGALAILNNLSDLNNFTTALKNLGISPLSYPILLAVTNGQSPTNVPGESYDGTLDAAVKFEFYVTQGTTISSFGAFSIRYVNSVWQITATSTEDLGVSTGVVWSLAAQVGSVVQLQIAETGKGNGAVWYKKSYYPVTP